MRQFFLFLSMLSFGLNCLSQRNIVGSYCRLQYPTTNLILLADSSFKYDFYFDLQFDIACGKYSYKNDTIILAYSSEFNDTLCNKRHVNLLYDSAGKLRQTFGVLDKRHRPDSLYIKGEKLYRIVNGTIIKIKRYKTTKQSFGFSKSYFRRKYFLFGSYYLKRKFDYYLKKSRNSYI
ncbi:hypothetical protein GALL_220240 [mine drainage metagenome]|uniref:Uncharacterized protein n=1 Tax=mine drainage metagenome TaxID=410659 RepID=A0A1J5RKJ5_9ZZZZ